jgi:hypothetical protein
MVRRSLGPSCARDCFVVCLATVALAPQLARRAEVVVIAPTYQSWSFADPVPLDSINVLKATQISRHSCSAFRWVRVGARP